MFLNNYGRCDSKEKLINILILIIIITCGIGIYIRNLYGFDWSDETLYPVSSYRLLIGDKLFLDLHGVGQFGSALLLPITGIYKLIMGDLTGIMLFFRQIHNTINILIALYCYNIFKNIGNKVLILFCCISIIVFTPFCISSLSYNTLGLQLLLLSGVLVSGYVYGTRFGKIKLILSGMSYGFASQMYPGIVFAIFVIPIYLFYKKDSYNKGENRYVRVGLWTLGGIIVILLFFLVLVYNSSIEDMLNNFNKLFEMGGDAEGYENRNTRSVGGVVAICLQILLGIKYIIGCNANIVAVFTFISLIFFFCREKFGIKFKRPMMIIWALISVSLLASALKNGYLNINYLNIPFALMGPSIWLISGCRNNPSVMMYILGLFECFAIQMGSNNGIAGSSYGLFICTVAVIIYLSIQVKGIVTSDQYDERKKTRIFKLLSILCNVIIIISCFLITFSYLFIRVNYVYRDKAIPELTARLESGPGRPLYNSGIKDKI